MPPSWSQWDELILQTWKPCSAASTTVLSFPIMHRATLQMTSSGGKTPSHPQSSLVSSLVHPSSSISRHIPMPALVSALLSPSVTSGKHGVSSLDGNQITMTLAGQRQLDSNSLFKCSSGPINQGSTSNYMVTIRELSRAGGKATAGTDPPTPSSAESMGPQSLVAALSTLTMSQARTTLPTIRHEASTPPPPSPSLHSPSLVNSHHSSQTMMQTHHTLSSMLANVILHPNPCPKPMQNRSKLPEHWTFGNEPQLWYEEQLCKVEDK
jgi:hypothetical protein